MIGLLQTVMLLVAVVSNGVTTTKSTLPPYQLIFRTDSTSFQTGSVTITCRNGTTLEDSAVQNVAFWLNTTQDVQDVADIDVIGCCSINFNLTRSLEGSYTCGKNATEHLESLPVELISPQTVIPRTGSVQTNYSVKSGGTVHLQCPIQPGALLQYYYAVWYKDDKEIAQLDTVEDLRQEGSRYDIDQSTFSLIIHAVNVNDSSTNCLCLVFVANPLSGTNTLLYPEFDGTVTLNIIVKNAI